jgi:antitoxin component YwqK of YwqJK toxin-antitoxin module
MKKMLMALVALLLSSGVLSAQRVELIAAGGNGESFTGLKVMYNAADQKTAEIAFVNGKPEGKITRFYENGQVKETGYYLAGQKHGSWSAYNENGQLMSTAHFHNGNKDGEWLVWDTEGNLRYKLTYKNGEPVGEWAMFDERGKVSDRKQLENESSNAQAK